MFQQTFEMHDLFIVGILIVLEGVLSIDNALVLGLLAKRVPKRMQGRALTYGLIGAFVFRILAIAFAQFLLNWRIVKLLGGGYLLYVALKYFYSSWRGEGHGHAKTVEGPDHEPQLVDERSGRPLSGEEIDAELEARVPVPLPARDDTPAASTPRRAKDGEAGFWSTVAVIELTDIAFAIDSILAAIALVGSAPSGHTGLHPKLWVVVTGGMLGLMLMRVAAVMFIKLLERFPRFETTAYLLVCVIGIKLCADWGLNTPDHPHRLDFHSLSSPAFWIFWITMLICLGIGFIPKRQSPEV